MSASRRFALTLPILAAALAPADALAEERPVVVLLGDSIRMGYAPFVAEALAGRVEVISPEANGGDSANLLKNLGEWAIDRRPAVVLLNAGLHDLKVDRATGARQVGPDDYRVNLRAILARLERETTARVVVATTTPVLDDRHRANKPFDRREADVAIYNRIAREVAGESMVVAGIADLHAAALAFGKEGGLVADGVHFTEDASRALARAATAAIESALADPRVVDSAVVRRAPSPPTLDGRLDDPAWAGAEVIDAFPSFWSGAGSTGSTRARLLWDDEALYFAAELTDRDLKAHGTRRNDKLWLGDVFELFFKPSVDRPEYHEFQANPHGAILELSFPKRGYSFDELAARPPLGMEAVAVVDGTLDRPGDVDRGWTVEGKIPWSAMASTGGRPAPGDTWTFALCRFDYGPEGTRPILSSSAPLRRPSFHRYEDYGRLRFEGPAR